LAGNPISPCRIGDELSPRTAPAEKQAQGLIVGHYTQIIWRTTRHLGAAQLTFALSDNHATRHYAAIMCNYDRPGNQHGQPPY
jgi:hypothetical protein